MKYLFIGICILLLISPVIGAINITVDSVSDNHITWSWNATITKLAIDGYTINDADLSSNTFTLSGLESGTNHTIKIYNGSESGVNRTTTTDNFNFYVALVLGILCVITSYLYSRFIGFIGLMFGALLTMMSFSMDSFALLAGTVIAIASITAVFWGRGS